MTSPNIPEILVALAQPNVQPEVLRTQIGGTWTQTESEFYTDYQCTDAEGFRRVQFREPGPLAKAGAIIGLELADSPCVPAQEVRRTLGDGAPVPPRPNVPSELRNEIVLRGDVSVHLGFDPRTDCLVQASVRHPAASAQ